MIENPVIPTFEIGTLIGNLVAVAIIMASIMVLLYLVWGGIEWITSAGDKAGLESARSRITNALVGLAIVAAAWAIIILITTFLGFPFPEIPIPSLGGTRASCISDCDKNYTNPSTAGYCKLGCVRKFEK